MNPEETKEFIAALQGKDYIMFRFKKAECKHPKENIIERSEWMTWQERRHNPCFIRAVSNNECGWRLYTRKQARIFGYI